MRHLDLFSGIGGFALAASWVWGDEHEIVSFVEIDPFCQKVLKKHWPDVPIHDDIRSYKHDGTNVDLLTGGAPCQPFSQAGEQRSCSDDRYLWPEMLRVIRECHPKYVIFENVVGIVNLALDTVLVNLENQGYSTESFIIPACAVNAIHKRERVWIVAYSMYGGYRRGEPVEQGGAKKWEIYFKEIDKTTHDVWSEIERCYAIPVELVKREKREGRWGNRQPSPEPAVCRVNNGIPNQLDRVGALGNAIVPQVVVPIMETIKAIDTTAHERLI